MLSRLRIVRWLKSGVKLSFIIIRLLIKLWSLSRWNVYYHNMWLRARTGRELEFEVHHEHQPAEEKCRHATGGQNERFAVARRAVRERANRQAEGESVKNHEKIAFGREFLGEQKHKHTRVIAREFKKKNVSVRIAVYDGLRVARGVWKKSTVSAPPKELTSCWTTWRQTQGTKRPHSLKAERKKLGLRISWERHTLTWRAFWASETFWRSGATPSTVSTRT